MTATALGAGTLVGLCHITAMVVAREADPGAGLWLWLTLADSLAGTDVQFYILVSSEVPTALDNRHLS
jgi:hypothetical protein